MLKLELGRVAVELETKYQMKKMATEIRQEPLVKQHWPPNHASCSLFWQASLLPEQIQGQHELLQGLNIPDLVLQCLTQFTFVLFLKINL